MKIVVNTRSLISDKLDGIGWFTYQSLKRITQQHPEIDFIFLFDRPYSKEFIFSQNIQAIVLFPPARHPFLYILYYEWSVRRILKKLKPDLFLAPDGLLALGATCKQLAVVHDINFLHYPNDLKFFYSKYYNWFVPKFTKIAQRVATVSEFSKQDLVTSYGLNPAKIDVVYNGINEGYGPLSVVQKDSIRKKYTSNCPYFLFVGSQSPRKNLIRLIEAFDEFKRKSESDYKLLLVGSSFWGEGLIAEALNNSPFKSDIIMTGRLDQTELELVMGSAFALAFVSYFEGFGIPIIEAMQCEVPVICSNTSCMPEIAGDAALYINPLDVKDISAKMLQLHQNPGLLKDLVAKGNKRKLSFSWDQTANKLYNAMMQAIDPQK